MVSKHRFDDMEILADASHNGTPRVTREQAAKAVLYAHNHGEDLGEFIQMMGLQELLWDNTVINGVCILCGSGVIKETGEHIREDGCLK